MNNFKINRLINESIDEMLDGIIDDEISKHDQRMINDREYAFKNAHFPTFMDYVPVNILDGDYADDDDIYRALGDNSGRHSGISPIGDSIFVGWDDSPYNPDSGYEDDDYSQYIKV